MILSFATVYARREIPGNNVIGTCSRSLVCFLSCVIIPNEIRIVQVIREGRYHHYYHIIIGFESVCRIDDRFPLFVQSNCNTLSPSSGLSCYIYRENITRRSSER